MPGVYKDASPWECQGMILRMGSNHLDRNESHVNTDLITKQRDQVDREADNTGMHLEVKLGPILDTLLRYNTSWSGTWVEPSSC